MGGFVADFVDGLVEFEGAYEQCGRGWLVARGVGAWLGAAMRGLLVEDDQALQSYVIPLLVREGFEANAVSSSGEAVAPLLDCRADLVLLDVGLPDISGLDVCREIRRLPGYVPVILLTRLGFTRGRTARL